METSDCIIEGLYLGGVMAALNEKDLQDKKITHVLSVDDKPLPDVLTNKCTYKHVFALDLYDFDLISLFMECIAFIEEARECGGAVLVHCQAGMSRSATIVAAYIMNKLKVSMDRALELVASRRQLVRPNEGFQQQLQLFENMGCVVDKTHSEYRAYQLSKLAVKFKCGVYAQGISEADIPSELYVQPDYSAKGNVAHYKCRKCRMFLFHDGALMPHNIGEGESAFDWRSKVPANKRPVTFNSEAENCRQSLFVDPLTWMKGKIHEVQGKLHCPKCEIKIGSFVWFGEKCPCGAWVAPAFHIDKGKVDKIPSQPVMPRTHTPAAVAPSSSGATPQPHQIGAVSAFPGPSGGNRPLNHLPLTERSKTQTTARLSSAQPVAAVQPRVSSVRPTASAGATAGAGGVQSMDFEMGGGEPDSSNQSGSGPSGVQRDSSDIESGINSIHMDVDSG